MNNPLTLAHDPGTSDDSGRASERLTTSSVAPRDADSSRDRLSDASSRCSSGKGYICDSEGDDDKGSDGGSVVFASKPAQVAATTPSPTVPRKADFPTTGLPLSNGPLGLGGSASPVPVPPGPGRAPPAPSPAPAALPPPNLPPPYTTPMQPPHPAVDPTKPKQVKAGRWNAMHVCIAWEIYHHQAKQNPDKTATPGIGVKTTDMLRPPTHIFPPGRVPRSHEMPSSFPPAGLPGRPPYESGPMPGSFLGTPGGHLGGAVSPFGRYGSPFSSFPGMSPFAREMHMGGPMSSVNDPWRNSLQRTVGAYPTPPSPSVWSLKQIGETNSSLEAARREAEERERRVHKLREDERQLREREERQREREKEEKLRKLVSYRM